MSPFPVVTSVRLRSPPPSTFLPAHPSLAPRAGWLSPQLVLADYWFHPLPVLSFTLDLGARTPGFFAGNPKPVSLWIHHQVAQLLVAVGGAAYPPWPDSIWAPGPSHRLRWLGCRELAVIYPGCYPSFPSAAGPSGLPSGLGSGEIFYGPATHPWSVPEGYVVLALSPWL